MADPVLTLSGLHQVRVTGMDPGEPATEQVLPVVGVDDRGPMVRFAYEARPGVILPTRDRLRTADEQQALELARSHRARPVVEFRAHLLLDFDEAYTAGRAATSRPAFRFSLGLDEHGETQPDRLTALNMLLHIGAVERISFLEHDYLEPELWGEPGPPARVVLPPAQTWTDEAVHVLPTHGVDGETFAYRLGRRLTGGQMTVNLKPEDDAREIAAGFGSTGFEFVYYVYRASGAIEDTAQGPAFTTTAAWKITIPGGVNGHQDLPFAPLLVSTARHRVDRIASVRGIDTATITSYEDAVAGDAGMVYAPVFSVVPPPAPPRAPTGVDVLPASTKKSRWGRGR